MNNNSYTAQAATAFAKGAQHRDLKSSSLDAVILKDAPDVFQTVVFFVRFSPCIYDAGLIGTDCPQS